MRLAALSIPLVLGLGACATTEQPFSASAVERCGSVELAVTITDDDQILVNDSPATRDELVAAARAKDRVCNNSAAFVLFSRPAAQTANVTLVRSTLRAEVENLTLIEATRNEEDAAAPSKPS